MQRLSSNVLKSEMLSGFTLLLKFSFPFPFSVLLLASSPVSSILQRGSSHNPSRTHRENRLVYLVLQPQRENKHRFRLVVVWCSSYVFYIFSLPTLSFFIFRQVVVWQSRKCSFIFTFHLVRYMLCLKQNTLVWTPSKSHYHYAPNLRRHS